MYNLERMKKALEGPRFKLPGNLTVDQKRYYMSNILSFVKDNPDIASLYFDSKFNVYDIPYSVFQTHQNI